ncbi:MAG: FecCD family ABC transporter permease [Armatimonadota bacterium]
MEGSETGVRVFSRILRACIILLPLLVVSIVLNVSFGERSIPFLDFVKVVGSHLSFLPESISSHVTGVDRTIIWNIRMPRAILALSVGGMLAMAGAALQGLLLNPLADPYIVGVSSGAALGAGVATLLGLDRLAGGYGVPVVAFAFALGAMCMVYALARSAGRISIHSFLLAGIVVGSFLWALLSFVLALAAGSPAEAQGKIVAWLLGSFDAPDPWGYVRIAFSFFVFGLLALFAFSRDLNVFSMGEESAQHLGIEAESFKVIVIVISSLVTAAAVSTSGIIGFVGLVVPHICRKVFGPDHRVLIPASAMAGATLAVLADLASRAILPPSGLPVGIVTALLGAPFFLYILRTSGRR